MSADFAQRIYADAIQAAAEANSVPFKDWSVGKILDMSAPVDERKVCDPGH